MGGRAKRPDLGPIRRPLRPHEREYLQQRRQAVQPGSFRFQWTALMVLGILVMVSGMFNYTYAYFYDSVQNSGDYFQAAHIDNYLYVYPGKATATFPAVGDPSGETRPAAFYDDNGELVLDFGEMAEGFSGNFSNLLRLQNITGRELKVGWRVEGDISQVVAQTEGRFTLLPDELTTLMDNWETTATEESTDEYVYTETYSETPACDVTDNPTVEDTVDTSTYEAMVNPVTILSSDLPEYTNPYSFGLKFSVRNEPGTYKGYLIITVDGEFLSLKIPAKIVIREKKAVQSEPVVESVYSTDNAVVIEESSNVPVTEGAVNETPMVLDQPADNQEEEIHSIEDNGEVTSDTQQIPVESADPVDDAVLTEEDVGRDQLLEQQ